MPSLIHLIHLRRLDVSSNDLGETGMRVLASRVLPHLRKLETLELDGGGSCSHDSSNLNILEFV